MHLEDLWIYSGLFSSCFLLQRKIKLQHVSNIQHISDDCFPAECVLSGLTKSRTFHAYLGYEGLGGKLHDLKIAEPKHD